MFEQNLREIEDLNSNPNEKARFKINEFGDWTIEERQKLFGL